MKLLAHDEDQIDVRLSLEELVLIRSVLDQSFELFHESEFEIRLGMHPDEAGALLRRIAGVLEKLGIATAID